jgi:hypothetical protein
MNEGRAPKVGHMNYGTIGRAWCPNCAEETIHVRGKCCRTGCNHVLPLAPHKRYVAVLPNSSLRGMENARQSNARRRLIKKHQKMESTRDRIRAQLAADPDKSFTQIAKECASSRRTVSRVAAEQGVMRINQHA